MPGHPLFVRIAPLIFVSIWSTGFIAAKYSMENADPFVFLCLRMSITSVALLVIILALKAPLSRRLLDYRHDMVTGVLLHCWYLGFVFWPIKEGMPSGIVAIIIGIQPIFTAVLATLYIGESIDLRKALGLLVGFLGVATVIFGKYGLDLNSSGGLEWYYLGLCMISLFAISVGVFYQKKFCSQSDLLSATMMQYVAASIATAIFAVLFGESWQVDWTSSFALALGWQVFGLSIGAVVLLMAIIKLGEASRVSSMFYLVPPLVVIEAHFLFGETLGALSIFGMLLCVVGVYFVNRSPKTLPAR
jgi:drug/metabolite transporter (DMT)-like permease